MLPLSQSLRDYRRWMSLKTIFPLLFFLILSIVHRGSHPIFAFSYFPKMDATSISPPSPGSPVSTRPSR